MANLRTLGFFTVLSFLCGAQSLRADYVVDGGFESYGVSKASPASERTGSFFDEFESSNGLASFDVLNGNRGRVLGAGLADEFSIRLDPQERVMPRDGANRSVSSLGQEIASRFDSRGDFSYNDFSQEPLEQLDLIMNRPDLQINSLGLAGNTASALGQSGAVNLVSLGNAAATPKGRLVDQINLDPGDTSLAQLSGVSVIADPTILIVITFSLVIALIRFPALMA